MLKSVKVIVEERRIDLEVNPGNWRTHEYTGLETVPERLAPAFAPPEAQAELNMEELVRKACASGKVESRFEAPYPDGVGKGKKTVLRTVVVHLYFRRPARARAPLGGAYRSPVATAMPMWSDGLWSRHQLQQVEKNLSRRYSKISPLTLSLVVRLAKLDLRPSVGADRLYKHAVSLIESRKRCTVN